MNIYEIKRRTKKTEPYYFSKDTMKFFGQTLKDFRVYKETNNIYLFTAPSGDKWNNRNLKTRAYFDAKTNKIRKSIEGLLIERAKKQ